MPVLAVLYSSEAMGIDENLIWGKISTFFFMM